MIYRFADFFTELSKTQGVAIYSDKRGLPDSRKEERAGRQKGITRSSYNG